MFIGFAYSSNFVVISGFKLRIDFYRVLDSIKDMRWFLIFIFSSSLGAEGLVLARLKYSGGGDWYNDPDVLPNLARELNQKTNISCEEKQEVVSLLDEKLFSCPFVYLTGHGNIDFSPEEVEKLRGYLKSGGFLYADDDYGMDESFRREIKKVFPNNELLELPFSHPLYHIVYEFPNGPPQIHEHYKGKYPKGFGIFYQDRLVVFYTYNSNISDGWTPAHNDPENKREEAFRMGINIVAYSIIR